MFDIGKQLSVKEVDIRAVWGTEEPLILYDED